MRLAFAFVPLAAAFSTALRAQSVPMPDGVKEIIESVERTEAVTQGAMPVFFPPEPPPLGGLDVNLQNGRWSSYRVLRAPPELAAFVGEPFYPALSTRLIANDLSRWSRRRVEEYRAAKLKLQSELRAELNRLRDASVETRGEKLTSFAREQTPKIVALEKTAEHLRTSLTKLDYRWGALRTSHLGEDSRNPESARMVAEVMRAAAYYEAGLLPAQRRFLREIAIELPFAADTVDEAVAAHPWVFFSPSLARVQMPEDVPPRVAQKIADYQAQRSALKKQLYDVVFKADSTWLAIVRGLQLHFSLGSQAAALDKLEDLAEDIRRDLARLPATATSAKRWAVPAAFTQRVDTLLVNQRALRTDTTAAVEAIRKRESSLDISYDFDRNGLQFDVRKRPQFLFWTTAETRRRATAAEQEIAAIAMAHRRAMATLSAERTTLRTDLARLLALNESFEVEAALAAVARDAFEQEIDGPYRAYRCAVFEPGLSPEQRRLLFDSAIEQLALPLPPGEFQPQ